MRADCFRDTWSHLHRGAAPLRAAPVAPPGDPRDAALTKPPHSPDFFRAPGLASPIFWHFARKVVPWVAAIAAYLTASALLVRWDMLRHGEQPEDLGASLYGMYMQLFFEPTMALPHAPVARVVFWVTPLLGAVLLARGLVRVGASVFDIEERRRLWVHIMCARMKDHIIVCGIGHVGIRIIESLRSLGIPVVAIDSRPLESFAPQAERLAVPVLQGDVRRDEILFEAGVQRARAIVCATDDDLTNLEVAIDSKRENPSIRVVMRVFDQRVAGKIGAALALEETFSPAALAGPLVALQSLVDGVLGVYRLPSGDLRADMEIEAPAHWLSKTVAACEDAIDGRIVGIRPPGKPLARPRHDTVIARGDMLTIDMPAANVPRLKPDAP